MDCMGPTPLVFARAEDAAPPPPPSSAGAEALSPFWRKNVSVSEPTELANVLRALRKITGSIGPNTGRVEYLGMSHGDAASIVVDPAMIMGEYPVPGNRMDYLVGLVTHEAMLKTEWTERVWKSLGPYFKTLSGIHRVMFQKIVQTGEDIYVDRLADRSVLGRYVAKTRGRALAEMAAKLRSEILTMDALVYLWWMSTWTKNVERLLEPVYEPPMFFLRGLTEALERLPDLEPSVVSRCAQRAELYKAAWENVGAICARLTVLDRRLVWWDEDDDYLPKKVEQKRRLDDIPPKAVLTSGLVHEIETRLALGSADITPLIRNVAGLDNPDVAPMSRWDYNIPAHPVVDRRMVGRVKAIFTDYAARQKVVTRGLTSGKVDKRRLYRAPISGKCFTQTGSLPDLDWNVTLLLDATGSMRGGKWRMVENTVGNLARALTGFKNNLSVYAYFEMDGIAMISSLYSGGKLMSVPPSGQTASGQAIIAAGFYMPKDARRKLLIHVTDGESNFGVDVETAIAYCRREKIHLVTLGVGVPDKQLMIKQYGKTIQFITSFGQLPAAVEKLLKWTFLYGDKRRMGEDPAFKKWFDPIDNQKREGEKNAGK